MIRFTNHAELTLKIRNINKKQVEETVDHPDFIHEGREGKLVYLKDFGKNYLKVILSKEADLVIITQYWLSKGKYKGLN